jgi:hypothetical protein
MKLRRNKILTLFVLILFFAALGFSFSHFHDGDHEIHECGACRLVQVFAFVFAVLVFLLTAPVLRCKFFETGGSSFFSVFNPSLLKGRSPPFLI